MISVEEKLSNFSSKVLDKAKEKRVAMMEEFVKEQESLVEEKELEFLEQAYEKIQKNLLLLEKQQKEKQSKLQNDYRVQLLKTRQGIFDDIFSHVESKLQSFMSSDKYVDWLKTNIKEAISDAGDGEKTIFINKSDEKLVPQLSSEFSLDVQISDEDIIGGAKVFNKNRNIISDHSISIELETQKTEFVKNSGLNINLL